MAAPTAYLTTIKNLDGILSAIQRAGVPKKFTYDFLKQLGFPSSGDRPVIAVLKALRFLDDGGVPLDRYKRYRDTSQSRAVMAEALRDTYADAFTINESAYQMSVQDLRGLFARLTGKSESVTEKMAITFKALSDRADFDAPPATPGLQTLPPAAEEEDAAPEEQQPLADPGVVKTTLRLHHDIHIHLPESREVAVYDAIFRALRQNFSE